MRKAGRPRTNQERDALISEMIAKGKTYTEIARVFNISRQRVAYIGSEKLSTGVVA